MTQIYFYYYFQKDLHLDMKEICETRIILNYMAKFILTLLSVFSSSKPLW